MKVYWISKSPSGLIQTKEVKTGTRQNLPPHDLEKTLGIGAGERDVLLLLRLAPGSLQLVWFHDDLVYCGSVHATRLPTLLQATLNFTKEWKL